jgi:hypothetical protein
MSSKESPSPIRCPSCQGDLVPAAGGLPAGMCRSCRRSYPSPKERAEIRAMFRQWRHWFLAVAELHQLGYEHARICPFIVDTPDGGDWQCIIAPAAGISPSHGARIDECIEWWRGTCSPGRDFPYYIGRACRGAPFDPGSAENLIRAYPKLAEQCLRRDREYVEWYREMLQTTEPEGIVYTDRYDDKDPPTNRMRVIGPGGDLDVLVPLPPPGKYPVGWPAREAPVLREVPARITSENVGRIRSGMASSDVQSILGDGRVVTRGECVERSGGNSVRRATAVLDWQEGSRRVTVTFENDKVLEVLHQGLE